jgi:hypothetical protein
MKSAGRIPGSTPSKSLQTPSRVVKPKNAQTPMMLPRRVPLRAKTPKTPMKEQENVNTSEADPSTPEQGSRRSSRRLAEQQQKIQENQVEEDVLACISVDSDETASETESPRKTRLKRKGVSPQKGASKKSPKKSGKTSFSLFVHS